MLGMTPSAVAFSGQFFCKTVVFVQVLHFHIQKECWGGVSIVKIVMLRRRGWRMIALTLMMMHNSPLCVLKQIFNHAELY